MSAGLLPLTQSFSRPLRTSWLIVGIRPLSVVPTEASGRATRPARKPRDIERGGLSGAESPGPSPKPVSRSLHALQVEDHDDRVLALVHVVVRPDAHWPEAEATDRAPGPRSLLRRTSRVARVQPRWRARRRAPPRSPPGPPPAAGARAQSPRSGRGARRAPSRRWRIRGASMPPSEPGSSASRMVDQSCPARAAAGPRTRGAEGHLLHLHHRRQVRPRSSAG